MSLDVKVYDPPLCCSSGVCGPSVDSELAQFASDLEWLKAKGVMVSRFNLAQQPAAFVESEEVRRALQEDGNDCLPLLLVKDRIVSRGIYPDRKELARLAGVRNQGGGSPEGEMDIEKSLPDEQDCTSNECKGKG